MAVEMEGVSARVVVVEYYLYNIIVFENVRIGIDAVDGVVFGEFACGESSVEGWDLGADIGYLVEECATKESQLGYSQLERGDILIGSVSKVTHGEV